jgi:hypothetical protein
MLMWNLVVFQIKTLKAWEFKKLLHRFTIWNQILLEIYVFEVNKAFKTLDFLDHVTRKIDSNKTSESIDTLYLPDGILMEIDHLKLGKALKVFNLCNTVALEPNTFDILVTFEILNFLKSFVMEIQGIVKSWGRKLSIFLTEFL